MQKNDFDNLIDIIESIDKIKKFTKNFRNADEFYNSDVYFDATLLSFINIGESISRLSEEIQMDHIEIEWIKIKNLRNLIAHDYFGVDAEEIWQIIKNKLPEFERKIKLILNL